MTTLSFEPGAVIGGRYRLESRLGEGGMGAVWRAQHTTLKSPLAVKFINPSIAGSESAISRFLLEAQSSAALRSTHIVQVFDFGVEQGVPYIAMELLHGETLADRLKRDKRIPVEEAAHILFDVSRAVAHAHDAGIVHRDLKPENIFLVDEKDVQLAKVLDFGVAKVTGGSLDLSTGGGTRTGAILGTPFYVSPEQGRGNQTIDHRSDLWALGIITYECVVGELPFDSQGLGDLIMKICAEPHPRASNKAAVPPGFDSWMDRALAKDPEKRFQSALTMFESFSELVLGRTLGGRISSSRASSGDRKLPSGLDHQEAIRPLDARATTTTGATASELHSIPMRKHKRTTWALLTMTLLAVAGAGFWATRTPPSVSKSTTQASSAPVTPHSHSFESPRVPVASSTAVPRPNETTAITSPNGTGRPSAVPAPAPSHNPSPSPRPAPAAQLETADPAPHPQSAPSRPTAATSPSPFTPPKVTSTRLQEGDPAPAPRPAPAAPLVPAPTAPAPAPAPAPETKPKPSREQLARELMRSYD